VGATALGGIRFVVLLDAVNAGSSWLSDEERRFVVAEDELSMEALDATAGFDRLGREHIDALPARNSRVDALLASVDGAAEA
jgi:hypothetical protein